MSCKFTCRRISPQPLSHWGLFDVPSKPVPMMMVDMGIVRGAYESVFIAMDTMERVISSIPVLNAPTMYERSEQDDLVLEAHGFDPTTIELE